VRGALALAYPLLKCGSMNFRVNISVGRNFVDIPADFWKRILTDELLQNCSNLEKILTGCEIIAAMDGMDGLLAA
jgi:hypothetical protein